MYKVIKLFTDIQDHNHAYRVGDEYPRKGLTVSEARLTELSSVNNKRGIPLIELVSEKEPEAVEIKAEMPEVVEREEEKPEEKITEITEEPVAEAPKTKRGRKPKK